MGGHGNAIVERLDSGVLNVTFERSRVVRVIDRVDCLLFRGGCDWVAAVFGHLEGHFVGCGIYFVTRRNLEERMIRFFSLDIGQSGDVYRLFPRVGANFEDRCGEIVGSPRLGDSNGLSVPFAVPRLVRRTPRAEIPSISR